MACAACIGNCLNCGATSIGSEIPKEQLRHVQFQDINTDSWESTGTNLKAALFNTDFQYIYQNTTTMPKVTPFEMPVKYPALRILITILYVAAGLFGVGGTWITLLNTGGLTPMQLAPMIIGVVFAFNFVVMAQIIKVFLDMEWNQRETNELLEQVIKNLPEQKVEG